MKGRGSLQAKRKAESKRGKEEPRGGRGSCATEKRVGKMETKRQGRICEGNKKTGGHGSGCVSIDLFRVSRSHAIGIPSQACFHSCEGFEDLWPCLLSILQYGLMIHQHQLFFVFLHLHRVKLFFAPRELSRI
ncbi:hypothetical protein NE237_030573 [Protea cynaroides]|uniref:Uncharacterized protein n=1 Tax=Protea cynaroides TaxID=273540 RepID=A0A9Q0GVB6_9MAGN|nr:hypothetical protein NE237_030573 [Protea cynaroides]